MLEIVPWNCWEVDREMGARGEARCAYETIGLIGARLNLDSMELEEMGARATLGAHFASASNHAARDEANFSSFGPKQTRPASKQFK